MRLRNASIDAFGLHSSSALRANHTAGTIPVHRSQADCEAVANPSRRHQETAMKLPAKPRILALSVAVIVAACLGCEPPPPPIRPAAPTPAATAPTTSSSATVGSNTSSEESSGKAATAAKAVELQAKNWDEVQAFVADHIVPKVSLKIPNVKKFKAPVKLPAPLAA